MTKLTQQEIETERGTFENWFLGFHGFNNSNDFLSDKNRYRNDLTNTYWYPWLARAELEKNGKNLVMNNNIKNSRDNKIIEFIANSMTTEQFKGFCYGNAMRCCLRLRGKDNVKEDIEDIAGANQFKLIFENKKHMCADWGK